MTAIQIRFWETRGKLAEIERQLQVALISVYAGQSHFFVAGTGFEPVTSGL